MGENIGAAARVMSNFGCCNLRIINPRDGWPNKKALEISAHGKFVVEQAEIFQDIEAAIADINYLIATTANVRYLAKSVNSPTEIVCKINDFIKESSSSLRIGLLFGRERSGLTNDEISFADEIIKIDTAKINPSLNLAQSVGIIMYELSKINKSNNEIKINNKATQLEISYLVDHLIRELSNTNFFGTIEKKFGMIQNIRNMIMRANLTSQDVRTIRGIIKILSLKNMNF